MVVTGVLVFFGTLYCNENGSVIEVCDLLEKYDNLKNMLEEMAVPEHSSVILDWVTGGRVFLDYIHLSQTVDRIVKVSS